MSKCSLIIFKTKLYKLRNLKLKFVPNTCKLKKIKLDVRPMSQQNLWSLPQSTYSLVQGRALLQHGVQVLLSRILGVHWILHTKLVFQVKYNWWPERLGNILFRNNKDSLKYLYFTMFDFLLLFFKWIISMPLCLVLFLWTLSNIYMMRSRVTYFVWWIWETKDNPVTGSIKHIFVQGFACDQCHMFLLYSMVPFIFIYIA